MKKTIVSFCFSMIILILFSSSSFATIQYYYSPQQNNYSTSDENRSLKELLIENIIKIANRLILSQIEDNLSGIKWNKNFELENQIYSKFYYGYDYGTSGIGDFFTNLYNETLNTTYLSVATKAFDYIYAHGITNGSLYNKIFKSPGFVFWTKSEDISSIYSGMKYGNAGTAKFMINLYLNTRNSTFLTLAEMSLATLINKSIDASSVDPLKKGVYWGYSLLGDTPITDVIYGNAGISSVFLDAYLITQKEIYLETALDAMKWIISESEITNNLTDGQRFVRYSPDPSYPLAFTGYLTGNSGIGSVFLKAYSVTNNQDYLLFARQIGNWLIANEKNGLWNLGAADLLTDDINEAGFYTGYGAGSAGIGIFLLDLYSNTLEKKFISGISKITEMFRKLALNDENMVSWTIQNEGTQKDIIRTDLKMGLAGIGLFFSSLYHNFGLNESLQTLQKITNFLISKSEINGMIPTFIGDSGDFPPYDLSYLEGITGIGSFYLETFKNLNTSVKFDFKVYNSIVDANNQSIPFLVFSLDNVLFFILLVKIISIRKKTKTNLNFNKLNI
jgi:hypothetical protein